MAVTTDPSSDPEAVPLGLLRRYLVANHWRKPDVVARNPLPDDQSAIARAVLDGRTGGRRDFDKFVLSESGLEDVEIILPRDKGTPDYLRQVHAALRTLSDVEDRDIDLIIGDVRLVGFDVMRSSIPNSMVFDDTILLEVATGYITGIRNLLAATATTEMQPDPFFLRVRKEATQFANNCRFAHTFRGSFGFTVESPLMPNEAPTFAVVDQPVPFPRRVIERMVRGVTAVVDAVARDDMTDLVANAKIGFGANAYEQFATLIEETSFGGMAFAFAFSPEWRPAPDLVQVKELVVGPQHVEVTRIAAKQLRQQLLPRAETVTGRVVNMASEDDPSDLMNPLGDREIAIKWVAPEGLEIRVRVTLSPADYLHAHAAHGSGRPVRVSGTLERRGKRWVLSSPTGFGVT